MIILIVTGDTAMGATPQPTETDGTSAPFYDRSGERQVLREVLSSPQAELVILYGRRGVGKSALLQQSLEEAGFRHIFYRATRRTLPLQLAALTDATREAYPEVFLGQPFASVPIFLEFLAHLSGCAERNGSF
jgi:AAA+ ATPase superfamily predicted ATPase